MYSIKYLTTGWERLNNGYELKIVRVRLRDFNYRWQLREPESVIVACGLLKAENKNDARTQALRKIMEVSGV